MLDIEEGHFGDISLDGLCVGLLAGWPGAIHEGSGVGQVIIDQRADEDQREALYKIVSGAEIDRHGPPLAPESRHVSPSLEFKECLRRNISPTW